jgi:tetratricopeptide (TPR) repeat protein
MPSQAAVVPDRTDESPPNGLNQYEVKRALRQPPERRLCRPVTGFPWQIAATLYFAVFVGLVCLYWPALSGRFVFDDLSLPFSKAMRDDPLSTWISGVRPILMFSYWLNYHFWGTDPDSYHLTNLAIHFVNTGLVFLVLCRLLTSAGWAERKAAAASVAGALTFAFHPLQTESVSYVAGRSESLASLFLLLAYVVFLYRREEAISWREALLVVILFGVAVKTKENAVSLAGILVLTDLSWPAPFSFQGLKKNWRLYALLAPAGLTGVLGVARVLATAESAGFSLTTYKWYQYAFTEARTMFSYIGLTIFPVGLSIDQDYPPSHTILEHGAIFYMILLAGLLAAALFLRRRYPVSCFGLLMFLIWLAPTSSIVPLDDAFVERRMYLPLVGLILIACELISRVPISRASFACALTLALCVLGKLCFDRNQLWGTPEKLVEMAAAGAVYNPRPLLNFTGILIQNGRCDLASSFLERAEPSMRNNYHVNAAWGRVLACLGRYDQALRRLETATRIHPCSQVYEWTGLVYGEIGRIDEAGRFLQKAVETDPKSETAHASLGLWFEKTNNMEAAEREYRTALALDRNDVWANVAFWRVRTLGTGLKRMQ